MPSEVVLITGTNNGIGLGLSQCSSLPFRRPTRWAPRPIKLATKRPRDSNEYSSRRFSRRGKQHGLRASFAKSLALGRHLCNTYVTFALLICYTSKSSAAGTGCATPPTGKEHSLWLGKPKLESCGLPAGRPSRCPATPTHEKTNVTKNMKLQALEKAVATACEQARVLKNQAKQSGQAAQSAKDKARQAKGRLKQIRQEAKEARKASKEAKRVGRSVGRCRSSRHGGCQPGTEIAKSP